MATKSTAILRPNLGLYLDRPSVEIPSGGLSACNNVRIENGKLTNQAIGWDLFLNDALNGPVTLIDNFFLRSGSQVLIFGTTTDLYQYIESDGSVSFITPVYNTGTVSVTNGSATVTGTGTTWSTNLQAGDQISVGNNDEVDPAATWYTIDTVDSDTSITLTATYAGTTASAQDYTGRKLFTGEADDWFSTETFPKAQPDDKDYWYATNGVDDIVRWDGTSAHCTIPDLDFRCSLLFRYKNMLIYGNLTLDTGEARPYSIRTSAIGSPENVTTDEAAEYIVSDSLSAVNGLYSLGDNLVLYTERSITLAQFVGPPVYFIFRTAVDGLGPLTGRLIADFGDFHEFLGPDTGYRFDGVGLTEIGYQVWRETLRKQDPNRIQLALSHFDEERGVVMWAIPLTTDTDTEQCATALLEHYVEDVGPDKPDPYTRQDFPVSATGFFQRQDTLRFSDITDGWDTLSFRWNDRFFQAAFPLNLMGGSDGKIYQFGTTDNFGGSDIESYARFGRRVVSDERTKGAITRIYPFAEQLPAATYTLGVLVWKTDQLAGELELGKQLEYDLTHASKRFVCPRVAARFAEIEFATTGTNQPWTLQGWDWDTAPLSER